MLWVWILAVHVSSDERRSSNYGLGLRSRLPDADDETVQCGLEEA